MNDLRRVGILGGTFDPVHYGHLLIAENAREQFLLDEIWFVPTGASPHKNDSDISDSRHRVKMLCLAIQGQPHFKINECEVYSHEISYTYRTLEYFSKEYPETDFYFIMGADSLFLLEHWKQPEMICRYCTILVAVRDTKNEKELEKEISYLKDTLNADIYPLNTPNFYVSSHEIRNRAAHRQTIKYLVPDAVVNYIIGNRLYYDGK
ncbi:MAG: nicotinate-nucleotide adenylyltransferase [Eubacterium sp.]|jgi:nicotinate (nicotinamide) nucleotide adenylyltransferase|nr:nicotinate-nucleotide adenylyltransferase [Eubacterium sp.]